MPKAQLVSSWWRRKLRQKSIISLAGFLVAAVCAFAALLAPSYHHGIVRDFLLSPIHVDVSLTHIHIWSECNHWEALTTDGWLDVHCRQIVGDLDGRRLDDAVFRTCSITSYLNIMSGGIVCMTIAALDMAGRFVVLTLTVAIGINLTLAAGAVILICAARDPLGDDPSTSDSSAAARLPNHEQINPEKAHHLDRLRERYETISVRLAAVRAAVRGGAVFAFLTIFWAPLMYPWLGEDIHLSSMPLLNLVNRHNIANDPTSLGLGYMTLVFSATIQFIASTVAVFLLPEMLTAPLSEQKQWLASSKCGQRARYDGIGDLVQFRESVINITHAEPIALNEAIVHDEIVRLMNSNVSPVLIGGEPR